MAKSRLTPDYIEWVMSLNANQALREIHKVNEETKEFERQQNAARQAIVKLEAEGKKYSKEWQNLKKSIADYGEAIKTNNEKQKLLESRLDTSQKTANQLKKQLKALRNELNSTSKAIDPKRYKDLSREIDETQRAYLRATGASRGFLGTLMSFSKMKTVINGFFMGIGQQLSMVVLNGFREGVNVIIDFEKANSKLAGVLGSTKAGIAGLTDEARRLGATTAYTASEVTGLQVELAKLGFNKDQIKSMEEAILKFALAVDTDLGSAASVAGGALRAFGLEAEDAEAAMATLAIGTTTSALSFNDYATMLSTTAPVAKAFGFTLEDTVALMGALKNANFDASSAATATRNILLNLADGSGKLATALGGPVTNLDELAAGLKKLQAEGIDLATALELTDKRSVAAFETFINNADTLTTLRNGVTDCTSAFNDMYKEMGDNVQGSINILKSTFEGLILQFYEAKGGIKAIIDAFTWFVGIIGKVIGFINRQTTLIKMATAAYVAYKTVVRLSTIEISKEIIVHKAHAAVTKLSAIWTKTLTAGKYALAAATALFTGRMKEATAAAKAFNDTCKKNLLGLVISLAIAAGIAIYDYCKKANQATAAQKALSNAINKATDEYDKQAAHVKTLVSIIQNENVANDVRRAKINELKKIIPGYNAE